MPQRILQCRQHRLDLTKKTYVMGVLNLTPDSFSDGGSFLNKKRAFKRALEIEAEGADIIDIGGESSRPGALGVSEDEEFSRVIPVIKALKGKIKIPISVDTTKPRVAKAALREGASIINDISGLRNNEGLALICASYSAGLVIMHMKGSPRTMQKSPRYANLLGEIGSYFREGIEKARRCGLKREHIIIDPGIGFGKTIKHNLALIEKLGYFKKMGCPLLVGLSRKSFMGKILNLGVTQRLIPTVAVNAIAAYNGADILRAHDVKEAVMTARMVDAVSGKMNGGR